MTDLENNLREICKRKGLRLSDVADRVGTSQSNLVSSVKGNPTISKLQDIATALQVPVSELLTLRPEKAKGIVVIDGQTFQLSRPSVNVVQIPQYDRYDEFRREISTFIRECIKGSESRSKMGMLESFEVFSLVFDYHKQVFHLSLCYGDGKTLTCSYDKLEFCGDWRDDDTEETVRWDTDYLIQEIINDLEGAVISKLEQ